jgi:hypothetical protein
MRQSANLTHAVAGLLCATLAACASTPPVALTTELTRAEYSIDNAERNDAPQYGATALSQARDKLTAAKQAADDHEYTVAVRLAAEAEVDARLASAQADRGKSEASLKEINDNLTTLQRETQRESLQ